MPFRSGTFLLSCAVFLLRPAASAKVLRNGAAGADSLDLVLGRRDDDLIPKIIHFTGSFEPTVVVERNKQFVPEGTEFRYYDNQALLRSAREISGYLEQEGVPGAYEALVNLRPWAYRADLWRYMVVWHYGGIYTDAKFMLATPLTSFLAFNSSSVQMCMDGCDSYATSWFAAPPRNNVLKTAIQGVVANLQARSYGVDTCPIELTITGPFAFTNAVKDLQEKPTTFCKFDHATGVTDDGIEYDANFSPDGATNYILSSKSVHEGQHQQTGSYNYFLLSHQLYCDEAGPPCENLTDGSLRQIMVPKYWSQVV